MPTMHFTLMHVGHTSLSMASIAWAGALLVLTVVVAVVLDRRGHPGETSPQRPVPARGSETPR